MFKQKLESWKTYTFDDDLERFPHIYEFSDGIHGEMNKSEFLIHCDEIGLRWEELGNEDFFKMTTVGCSKIMHKLKITGKSV